MSGDLNWIGISLVATMFGVFLIIGWLASRKSRDSSAADLILAGRAMPLWIAVMTMTATWVDGGYINGTAEQAFVGSITYAFQPGFCFGISLILGGIFFAKKMRAMEFSTLIDPFELRFGKQWASVLFIPAMIGELIWSAALLAAISSTFNVLLGFDTLTSMVMAATVVTIYTMAGGMWAVACTDSFQLILIPVGLLITIPFALSAVGGLDAAWDSYSTAHPHGTRLFPPLFANAGWNSAGIISWWDTSILLVLGGIPWNCYFQRVLSCKTPERARWHSIFSGFFTIALTVPPLILGIIAAKAFPASGGHPELWGADGNAANALPMVLRDLVPTAAGMIGLIAILGAVTSSYSSSILSAGTMLTWNVYRPLVAPQARDKTLKLVTRLSILCLGMGAVGLTLASGGSVYQLWAFSADLIFVLLLPQLIMALYDPKTNLIGSIVGFAVALFLRLGGGEPLFEILPFIDYTTIFSGILEGPLSSWTIDKATLVPYKTMAAVSGIVLIPVVSRLTAGWSPPRPLPTPPPAQGAKA